MKNQKNNKKIILALSIVVATICLVVGVSTFLKRGDEIPEDKYVTSELIENVNTLEKDQMEELARKTLIVMSDKSITDSKAINVDTSGIMTVLTYDTSKDAKEAYDRYSKDESILLCEYDKTVNVQHTTDSETSPIKTSSDDALFYYESVSDMMYDELKDTSNKKIYDKIISNIGKSDASKVPTIVVIDTGYNGEADYKYNAVDGSSDVSDSNGHGTSMVNIVKTQMGDIEFKLAIVKIANEKGLSNTSYLVKAFEYIGTIDPTVINMSFITTDKAQSDVLLSYVNKFSANGVAVVCSAGNLNDDASNYIPSSFDFAIVVGSCDESGNKKDFSNFGSTVDMNIVSSSTSEASAKVSSLYAIAYATSKNIASVLNDSNVIFEPSGGEYIKASTSLSSSEEVNENLWWWCVAVYGELDYYDTTSNRVYTDKLKNNPYDKTIKYNTSIVLDKAIQVGDIAGSKNHTFNAGDTIFFGHNCYNKVKGIYDDDYPNATSTQIQNAYLNATIPDTYYNRTEDEPTFIRKNNEWYVSLGPRSIYCKKHNNFSTIGSGSGWYNLESLAKQILESYTLTINPNGGTMDNGDSTTTSSFTTKFIYGRKTYVGNLLSNGNFYSDNAPTRSGYTFKGWKFSAGTGGQNTAGNAFYFGDTANSGYGTTTNTWIFNGDYEGNVTATAIWESNLVNMYITYDAGVASVSGAGAYQKNTSIDIGAVPKTGYKITGVKDLGNGAVYTNSDTMYYDWYMGSDRYVHIMASPNNYKITFNPNGGSLKDPGSNLNNGSNTDSVSVIYNAGNYWAMSGDIPIRAGYKFNGWYTATSGGVQVYDASGYCTNEGTYWKDKVWVYASDVTLYAQWTPNKLTIYYNANGGIITNDKGYPMDSDGNMLLPDGSGKAYKEIKYNAADPVNVHNIGGTFGISKTGYSVVSTKQYLVGSPTSSKAIDHDSEPLATFQDYMKDGDATITLYANWAPNKYTVALDGNGATSTNHTTSVQATYNAALPSITIPARQYTVTYNANGGSVSKTSDVSKYTFNGYFTKKSGGTKYYTNAGASAKAYDIAGNTTLYAQWTSQAITLPTPTRSGYTFSGWYDGDGNLVSGTTYTPTKNVTLKAEWTQNTQQIYTIALNNQGATSTNHTTAYYEKYNVGNYKEASCTNTITKITVPKKTGYTFGGYYTATNGSGTQYVDASGNIKSTSTTFKKNTTLYAKWTENKLTIYYNMNGGEITSTEDKGYPLASDGYMMLKDGSGKAYKEILYNDADPVNVHNVWGYFGVSRPGWHLAENEYLVGSPTSSKAIDHDAADLEIFQDYMKDGNATLTLYANWVLNSSTLTINPNGGIWEGSTTSLPFVQNYNTTKEIADPKRDNYEFGGWTVSGNAGTLSGTTFTFGKTNNGVGTLTAKWIPKIYKITLNNQSPTTAGTTVFYEKYNTGNYKEEGCTNAITTITIPKKTGYTFGGYYTKTNGGGTQYVDASGKIKSTSTTFKKDTTLYAKWTANKYTVTLDGNGATSTNHTTSVPATYKAALQNITIPTRQYTVTYNANGGSVSTTSEVAKYTFNGYFTATSGGTQYYTNAGVGTKVYDIASNTTFYAQWTESSVTLPTPTRTGYTFSGWYTAASGGTKVSGTTYIPTKNITLYAHWTPNVYKVTLNNQGATSTNHTTVYYEKYNTGNYKESACTNTITKITVPKKTGYIFGGYYTATNGGGTQYVDASGNIKSTSTTFKKNTTLYAKWTPTSLTIYYNVNGGEVTTDKGYTIDDNGYMLLKDGSGKAYQIFNYESADPVNVSNMSGTFGVTRPGYHLADKEYLVGSATSSKEIDHDSEPLSTFQDYIKDGDATIDLFANWKLNTYSLTVNPNGGTWNGYTTSQTYSNKDYGSTMAIPAPTREGYIFAGWTGSGNAGSLKGTTFTFGKKLSDGTVYANGGSGTLTAKWTSDAYEIALDPNGGTSGTTEYYEKYSVNNYKEATCENVITKVTIPTRVGYTFKGYYTETSGGTQYVDANGNILSTSTTFTESTTLYAQWTAYKITFYYNANGGVVTTDKGYTIDSNGYMLLDGVKFAKKSNYSDTGYVDLNNMDGTFGVSRPGYSLVANKEYKINSNAANAPTITHNRTLLSALEDYVKDGNVTLNLYANWTPNQYQIILEGNGATSTNHSTFVNATYDSYPPSITIPTRQYTVTYNANGGSVSKTSDVSKYTFNGYFTATSGGTKYYTNAGVGAKAYDIVGNTTFYAQWTAKAVTLPTPTKDGYTFNGWYTAETGGTRISGTTYTPTKNVTLYARWGNNSSTLTINPNGGTWEGSTESQSFVQDYNTTKVIANPARDNYTFGGWTVSGNAGTLSGTTFTFGATNGASSTLTAKWTPKVYKITLDNQGATTTGTTVYYEKYGVNNYKELTCTNTITTITIPTKTGYTFGGYYTGTNGSGTQYVDASGNIKSTSTTFTKDTTLYAKWTINKSTLTVNPNGGTWNGYTTSQTFTQNYNTTKVIANPTRTGYEFGGWTISGSAGTLSGTTFTFGATNGGVGTLTAKWTSEIYTITLDPNGGTVGTSAYYEKYGVNNYKEQGCTNTITTITIPTRDGYTFKGYYTATSGGTQYVDASGKILSTSTTFTKDTTLYAKWTINKSTLTVNPNGGIWNGNTTSQTFTQDYNTTKEIANPTRDNYEFAGWTVSGSAGTLSGTIFTFDGAGSGSSTLTAKWTPKVYKITLNNQSATTTGTTAYYEKYGVNNYKEEGCTNTITKITIPTKTGYTFGGYYTSTNGSGTQYVDASGKILSTSTTFTKDTTLYAKWTINSSKLTINPNGGTWNGSTTSQTFTQNYNTTKVIANPTRNGYTFNGWVKSDVFTAGTLSGTTFTFGATSGGVGTLTASWKANPYTVTLDGNGATSTNHTTSVEATYNEALPSVTIPVRQYTVTYNANGGSVSKTSDVSKYTFNGYFTATSGGTKYYTNTGVGAKVYDIVGNTTLYAQWASQAVTLPTPTRAGYTFDGWYTASTGGTKISGTTYTPSSDITLYARWISNAYTLTINPNGGSMWNGDNLVTSSFTTKFVYGRKTYMGNLKSNGGFEANNAPVRLGYAFNGFTFSGGTGSLNTSGSQFYFGESASFDSTKNTWIFNGDYAGNVTATAQWKANKYTINYYNGATSLGSSNHEYDKSSSLKTWSDLGGTVINSEYGWTFAGWSTSSDSTTVTYTDGQSVTNLTSVDGGTINLYAVYKRTITFKHGVNGSTTDTRVQNWNPYGTTNGKHISSVVSPALKDVSNWSANGFRNDTTATPSNQDDNATIYPPVNQSPTFYGVYERVITFKSGVNATTTDSTTTQYLTSYNNVVSSIKSGTPSAIANWTPLGYRDDTTAGGKEYGIASTISPAYTTGNTFYATYSRTLTIKYDANNKLPLTATGSVADTTKVIYMNAYQVGTSDQSITLKENGFTYVGFKFVKWDKGAENASYNPKLAYNHSTFIVVVKAEWEHDDSGVGTLKNPTLKVNNPNASGIYYSNGVYFVKGDGQTIVELYGEATLNPALISRLDKLSLNDGEDMLTSNPKYIETYYVEVPKSDVWGGIYDRTHIVNYNTHTGLFKALGSPTIVDLAQGKLSFTQKFAITGRVLEEKYIGARACCVSSTCTDDSHTINMYGNSVRLHGDPSKPYAYIVDEAGEEVSINDYDTKWTNQDKVTIEIKDDDSGIKYYKLTKESDTVEEVTTTTYVTSESIELDLEEGVTIYTLEIVDNVGNEITYTFTFHVDRTTPSLTDLIDFKVMGDGNVTQSKNDVYAGSLNTWPTTSQDVTWEYDWQKLKELKYKATDDRSGLRKVVITHYKQDSSYTTAWSKDTLVNVSGDVLDSIKEKIITSFNGDSYYPEGKSYLLVEMEDLAGNKTSVKLVVRRDKNSSSLTNIKVTGVTLEGLTNEQLETLFANGDMSKFNTNVRFNINDNISTSDTSGIKKVEIVVRDPKTNVVLKRYDVTSNLAISSYTTESGNGSSKFSPLVRPLSGSINVNIDTLGEFPSYSQLKISIEVTDYVGNKADTFSSTSGGTGEGDGGIIIANYAIKTTMYATKDNAYNLASLDGSTNMPYFKTGEVGFIEVWSVGYVDKLELDFSEGSIGQEMNQAIANGQVASKYILGIHNGLPNQVRYVTDMSKFKVNTSYADYNGVPYAAHISYSFDEVNNSFGSTGVDGWKEKGTMIRIPTNHELVKKNQLDKYGNELYQWETHLANVYPVKNGEFGSPSGNYYTIWDESGDDLHFRITHLLFSR